LQDNRRELVSTLPFNFALKHELNTPFIRP
jgi:hypothetical protein